MKHLLPLLQHHIAYLGHIVKALTVTHTSQLGANARGAHCGALLASHRYERERKGDRTPFRTSSSRFDYADRILSLSLCPVLPCMSAE